MSILIAVLIFSTSIFSSSMRKSRWTELMGLISQEMRLLERASKKGPELSYRMLELRSEKLKLLHEKNNSEFLETFNQGKKVKPKEQYFIETRTYYQSTRDFGLKILTDHPRSPRRAEVLFALALNSRDYGLDNITEKYLIETISLIPNSHDALRHHAETALADYYYNEKRYQDGIHFYERIIKKSEDTWLSKHYLNLSWCYLKSRNFDNAISAIKMAYNLSKNRKYINIREQVLDNVGTFYVYSNRPLEGLEFYLKNEKDPVTYLLSMSQKTSEKGLAKETEEILGSIQKLINKNGWIQYQEDLYIASLDFYRHYNRFFDFDKVSSHLVHFYKASNDKREHKFLRKDEAVEKIRSLSGFLQIKLSKNMKEGGGGFNKDDLEIVLNFFNHLISLDPINKAEYLYFKGETYFSVKLYSESALSYEKAIIESKLSKNEAIARKSIDSLLLLTSHEVFDKQLNQKYLMMAYADHLLLWPRHEKSEKIYPKLFSLYLETKKPSHAISLLSTFNNNYPELISEQHILITKVLDFYIEAKDTKNFATLIRQFKSGFLKLPSTMVEKSEITLGNMLFLEYQEMAKRGNLVSAADGFVSIHNNELYTDKIKSQSAYFASLSFLELGDTRKTFEWQLNAHKLFTKDERVSKRSEQVKISERLFRLQDFKTTFSMSSFFLTENCAFKDDLQSRLYEIAVTSSLVENDGNKAKLIAEKNKPCLAKIDLFHKSIAQVYHFFVRNGDFRNLRSLVRNYSQESFVADYPFVLQKWFWEKSDLNFKDAMKKELGDLNTPVSKRWLAEINDFQKAHSKFNEIADLVIWDRPVFSANDFNKSLELYLVGLKDFKTRYEYLMNSDQLDLALNVTNLFSNLYLSAGKKIISLRPMGMDDLTYKDFHQAMKQVSTNFLTISEKFSLGLKESLLKGEYLTTGSRMLASQEQVENPIFSSYTALIMDDTKGE